MKSPEHIEGIGQGFDIIQLNAVFEHSLPHGRLLLWRRSDNGYLVITETPWRRFPIETPSPVPICLALAAFRGCARFPDDASLEYALRDGLRGATVGEIIKSLDAAPATVRFVEAQTADARDQLECWWQGECRKTRQKVLAYDLVDASRRDRSHYFAMAQLRPAEDAGLNW